ncbi:MAG: PAS domain S-box protein, partial [Deferribacterales bacterium]
MDEFLTNDIFKTVLDSAKDAVVILNPEGRIIYWNKSAEDIFGYSSDEVMGSDAHELLAPKEFFSKYLNAFPHFKKTGEGNAIGKTIDLTAIRKDGEIIEISLSLSSFKIDDGWYAYGFIRDITEMKKIERELKDSYERFRVFEECSSGGIIIHDKGLIIECNSVLSEMTGYSREELIGMNGLLLASERCRKEVMEKILSGYGKPYEAIAVRKNGEEFPVRIHGKNVTYKGKLLRGTEIRDLSDIKKLEHVAETNERNFYNIFNSMNDTGWIIDFDTSIVDVNDAACRVLGYSKEELLSMKISDIDPYLKPEMIQHLVKSMLEDNFQRFESKHRRKDGHLIDVEISSNLITYSNRTLILSIARDITDRKRVEEHLKHEYELFSGGPVFIIEWLPENHWPIRYVSKNIKDILGFSPEYLMSKEFRYYGYIHPDDIDRVRSKILYNMEHKVDRFDDTYRFRDANGSYRWLYDHTIFERDESGSIVNIRGYLMDITEQKNIEYELKLFSDIVFQSPVSVMVTDIDGNILYVNPAFTDITGYSFDEVYGKNPRILSSGRHPKAFYDDLWNTINSGKVWKGEFINKRKDGSIYYESAIISPVKDEKGFIRNFMAIKDDVTVLKGLEDRLKEERDKLSTIIEASQLGTWEWNIQTGETVFNDKWADIIGYTLDELQPTNIDTWIRFTHPEDLKKSNEFLERHLNGETEFYECEVRMFHKNGDYVWVLARGKVIERTEDGKPLKMFGVHVEITEFKKLERALKEAKNIAEENENRLLTFINSIPDIVCYKDGAGRWLLANEADLEIFQLKGVDYYGKTDAELAEFTHDRYNEAFMTCMVSDEEAWKRGTIIKGIEKIPTVDGGYKIYDVYKIPLFNDDGSRKGLAVIGRDITDLISVQNELIEAKEKAEESNRLKTVFLANMSHEIRTPMNGIFSIVELLKLTRLNEEQRSYIEIIEMSSEHLLSIINDILDIAIIEAGKLKLECSDFNLENVIDEVVSVIEPKVLEKDLELICDIDLKTPLLIKGDPVRLRQILINLVGNAVKFTDKGEIVIEVDVETEDEDNVTLKFYVKDTGIGIPEDKKEAIFDKFVQVDGSITRQYGGTGLGLAITKSLVEMMGGEIGVESTVGVGSTFWFKIRFEKQMKGEEKLQDEDLSKLKGINILVISKNFHFRDILLKHIAKWGMIPDVADNIDDALKMISEDSMMKGYKLVLIDEEIIKNDEDRFIKHLKYIKIKPIILVKGKKYSSNISGSDDDFCKRLIKPIKFRGLFNVIMELLSFSDNEKEVPCAVLENKVSFCNENLRVLLVEDNIVNQKVTKLIFEQLGLKIDVVSNGKESVEAVKQRYYDVIFMDLQMPIMDGLEATKIIRKISNEI